MYQFVNVRFNLDKDDERVLYENLDPKNRGGNIKKILKSHYLLEDENLFKKVELKSLIEEIVNNHRSQNNIKRDRIINKSNESSEIKINAGGWKLL